MTRRLFSLLPLPVGRLWARRGDLTLEVDLSQPVIQASRYNLGMGDEGAELLWMVRFNDDSAAHDFLHAVEQIDGLSTTGYGVLTVRDDNGRRVGAQDVVLRAPLSRSYSISKERLEFRFRCPEEVRDSINRHWVSRLSMG